MVTHEGGCLCGSVRYRAVVDDSGAAGHCHCGMCRK
ncbi:MAG: GFA family protein, partial [Alphaproteobacteria bacterium]|nr:GFA family protein [Alphaproteobacteria bacterium]